VCAVQLPKCLHLPGVLGAVQSLVRIWRAVAFTWNTCSGVQLGMLSLLGESIANTWVTCFHTLLCSYVK